MDGPTRHRHDRPAHGRYQRCAMPYGRRSHHSDQSQQANSPGCRSAERVNTCPSTVEHSHSHHQGLDVLLESLIVEALEGLSIVKVAAERVAGSVVLAEDVQSQLIGPPVTVLCSCRVSSWSWYGVMLCRRGPTFWPPPPVLAKRSGHFAGAFSSILPIVDVIVQFWFEMCFGEMVSTGGGGGGRTRRFDDEKAASGDYCRASMQRVWTKGRITVFPFDDTLVDISCSWLGPLDRVSPLIQPRLD